MDAELHSAAVLIGANNTHIVTRNRHTVEIQTFLEERGVPIAAVHMTPRGHSKALYMQTVLAEGERALFVDDSAGEVGEQLVCSDPRIFRVIMQR